MLQGIGMLTISQHIVQQECNEYNWKHDHACILHGITQVKYWKNKNSFAAAGWWGNKCCPPPHTHTLTDTHRYSHIHKHTHEKTHIRHSCTVLSRYVMDILVKCTYHTMGCPWTGQPKGWWFVMHKKNHWYMHLLSLPPPLSQSHTQNHTDECVFHIVKCPNKECKSDLWILQHRD